MENIIEFPAKEAGANKTALQSGIKSFKQISAEQGCDWKEQIDDMAEVAAYAKEKGIQIGGVKDVDTAEEKQKPEDPNE